MGTMPPDALVGLWATESITAERALGQALQHIARLHAANDALVRRVAALQAEVERATAAASASAPTTGRTQTASGNAPAWRRETKG